ncbi:MAG: PIN domain-containing protein [Paludibacteraceae bacterium]|nr:PIN domain-containing protein [Paludibacteraceae bacterium]
MKTFFVDTNVVIDFLAKRMPFAPDALNMFQAAFRGECVLYICSLSFTNIYYVLCRQQSRMDALAALKTLSQFVQVAPVTTLEINQALNSEFQDFEDAVQYFSACSIPNVSGIITRNPKDFALSALPIIDPKDFGKYVSF